ncbi:hypothetical protein GQF59_31470, partial [Escherichia coli]|nr:hypothetical protein [Escherichia coli]
STLSPSSAASDVYKRQEWHDGAAVRYRESQTLADGSENVRWSTAIFQQAEGKMIWRHLQETRLG